MHRESALWQDSKALQHLLQLAFSVQSSRLCFYFKVSWLQFLSLNVPTYRTQLRLFISSHRSHTKLSCHLYSTSVVKVGMKCNIIHIDDIVFLLGTLHWRCRRRTISIVTSHYSPSLSGTVVMSRDWLGWKWERPRNKTLVNDTIAYYRRNKGLDHFFVLTWSGKWEQSDFPVSNDRCFFKY